MLEIGTIFETKDAFRLEVDKQCSMEGRRGKRFYSTISKIKIGCAVSKNCPFLVVAKRKQKHEYTTTTILSPDESEEANEDYFYEVIAVQLNHDCIVAPVTLPKKRYLPFNTRQLAGMVSQTLNVSHDTNVDVIIGFIKKIMPHHNVKYQAAFRVKNYILSSSGINPASSLIGPVTQEMIKADQETFVDCTTQSSSQSLSTK
eukprot:c17798_g1_i2.p1 GENE.c17798_g1_i2~~c17798_g1_i2.p1  ORF type:complete len:214 (+),score=43.87 c17798_g1_i2:37-642(+)